MHAMLNDGGADDELPPPEDFAAAAPPLPLARPEDSVQLDAIPAEPPPDVASLLAMQNQAATLNALLNKEEISFEDYQRLLHEAMTQDGDGVWWMIDAETTSGIGIIRSAISGKWITPRRCATFSKRVTEPTASPLLATPSWTSAASKSGPSRPPKTTPTPCPAKPPRR